MGLNKKLHEVLGVEIEVITEDASPTEGMWYYIYLKPKWVRIDVKTSEYGEIGHPKFWEKYIVPKLIEHYGLEESAKEDLEYLCYSMPRGRVAEIKGKWHFFHGDDFPSLLSIKAEEKRLISTFNLTHLAIRDMTEFRVAEHEKMDETHKKRLQEIIGEVEY